MEDSNTPKKSKLLNRLKESASPAAAVAGAFASFASAARGAQSKPAADPGLVQIAIGKPAGPARSNVPLEFEYSRVSNVRPLKFQHSLSGISVGPADKIYVLADGDVRVFDSDGTPVRNWRAPQEASCITSSSDELIYAGAKDRIESFDSAGNKKGSFEVRSSGKPASITSIKVHSKEILVADAAARCIYRYDLSGHRLGEIGTQNKTGGFILPNRSLDIDIDAKGLVIATDSGRHRVSSWKLDGTPAGHFGKFGLTNEADFVGCCNPVNITTLPDGRIITAEKVIARVKVFDATGKLLALIGSENFDPKCTHLFLAVDSKKRILVADPVSLEIKIFSITAKPGGRENA